MLISFSRTSQSSFSCTCSCQICAALVNILSRWVTRNAACVVQGPSDARSARYWQKVPRGFEPRALDSESRALTVTPRGRLKLVAFCAPTQAGAFGVQTFCADLQAERHWRMSADRGGITFCCKAYTGVLPFGSSLPGKDRFTSASLWPSGRIACSGKASGVRGIQESLDPACPSAGAFASRHDHAQ
jgi:hypothetical protein